MDLGCETLERPENANEDRGLLDNPPTPLLLLFCIDSLHPGVYVILRLVVGSASDSERLEHCG